VWGGVGGVGVYLLIWYVWLGLRSLVSIFIPLYFCFEALCVAALGFV
jgi:hypothetical protein